MPPLLYAVRRAKGSDRQQGKRWVAQAEFPGGRRIELKRTRNKPPANNKLKQVVRQEIASAAKATGSTTTYGSSGPPAGKGYSGSGSRDGYVNVRLF